jgi:AbiV family abortive infection protein
MKSVGEVVPAIHACLGNAEKLIEAAKASAKPGSFHIAYHLASLALEEIGKSSMIFMSALNPRTPEDNEKVGPIKWIDDHERKLFWAIWLPRNDNLQDWKTIPESMEIARTIHNNRLTTLYVDPANLTAAPITEDQANRLIGLAGARLGMERLKQFRELDEDAKKEIQWFFAAMDNPRLKPMIFSKGSWDKQAEFGDDFGAWMKWLRETIEEADRQSIDLTNLEMRRVPPGGEEGYEDKFEVKLRLKSWSHSIRVNQFKQWNQGIDKIKLAGTNERNELMVTLMIPKMVKTQDLWNMGWQNTYVFVTALNIATMGFFWWYLPQFTSRYYEKMRDIEHASDIIVERIPELKMSWGHLALKADDLNNVSVIYTFIAHANQVQFEAAHRYFPHSRAGG